MVSLMLIIALMMNIIQLIKIEIHFVVECPTQRNDYLYSSIFDSVIESRWI